MKCPHTKKYSLAISASPRCNQKLQEIIFSPSKIKLKTKKYHASKNKTSFHRTVQTLTDTTSNVNLFGQNGCGLDTSPLRIDSRASGNRVARPSQNFVGRGSHTTLHADFADPGS